MAKTFADECLERAEKATEGPWEAASDEDLKTKGARTIFIKPILRKSGPSFCYEKNTIQNSSPTHAPTSQSLRDG